jgi:Domain of unknown function (DUF5666)
MQKRQLWMSLSGLVLAMLIACAPGLAQQGGMQSGMQGGRRQGFRQGEMAAGTIASVGVGQFEIKKRDGTAETVTVNSNTRYREGQQQIQLEDLKPGDHVFVRGQPNGQDQITAMMVRRVTEEEMARFQNRGDRAFGRIVSINGNEIKVQNRRQAEQTIEVTDQTTFMKDGQSISLKDLKVGDRIFAAGKLENGHLTAERVMSGRMRRMRGGMGGGQQPPPNQQP